MTTRRNFVHAAALAPLIAALPAIAAPKENDPAIIAIQSFREARAIYAEATRHWRSDEEVNCASSADCFAVIAALTTVPTTAAGFRAFCEFGSWLLSFDEAEDGGLGNWRPGNNLDLPGVDVRTADEMYFATLAKAARSLLPA